MLLFSFNKRLQKFLKSCIMVLMWLFGCFYIAFSCSLKTITWLFCDFYKNFLIVDLFGFDFRLLHLSVCNVNALTYIKSGEVFKQSQFIARRYVLLIVMPIYIFIFIYFIYHITFINFSSLCMLYILQVAFNFLLWYFMVCIDCKLVKLNTFKIN